jgi:hypothetical protein
LSELLENGSDEAVASEEVAVNFLGEQNDLMFDASRGESISMSEGGEKKMCVGDAQRTPLNPSFSSDFEKRKSGRVELSQPKFVVQNVVEKKNKNVQTSEQASDERDSPEVAEQMTDSELARKSKQCKRIGVLGDLSKGFGTWKTRWFKRYELEFSKHQRSGKVSRSQGQDSKFAEMTQRPELRRRIDRQKGLNESVNKRFIQFSSEIERKRENSKFGGSYQVQRSAGQGKRGSGSYVSGVRERVGGRCDVIPVYERFFQTGELF